jgi:hypothetical protein
VNSELQCWLAMVGALWAAARCSVNAECLRPWAAASHSLVLGQKQLVAGRQAYIWINPAAS